MKTQIIPKKIKENVKLQFHKGKKQKGEIFNKVNSRNTKGKIQMR